VVIRGILRNDLENCKEAIDRDVDLQQIQTNFYELIKSIDEKTTLKLESLFNEYFTRAIRIGYIQGMKDMNQLAGELKLDTIDILSDTL
jgi:hypothetical protein